MKYRMILFMVIFFLFFLKLSKTTNSEKICNDVCLKVDLKKKVFRYGETITIFVEIKNNLKEDNIILDIQPFYLLVLGSKDTDCTILYHKEKWTNYFLIGEKRSGGILSNHIDGFSIFQYSDVNIPFEVILKPMGHITEKIIIEPDLYEKYLSEGDWEFQIWQAWEKYDKKLNSNILVKKNMDMEIKINHIEDNELISIPVIKNYNSLIHGKPKGTEIKKYLIRGNKNNIAISEKHKITVCRSPLVDPVGESSK